MASISIEGTTLAVTLDTVEEVSSAIVEVRVPAQEGFETIAAISPSRGVIFAANALRLTVDWEGNEVIGATIASEADVPLTIRSTGGVKFVGGVDFSEADVSGLEVA